MLVLDGDRNFHFDFSFSYEKITIRRVIFRAFVCGAGVSLQGF